MRLGWPTDFTSTHEVSDRVGDGTCCALVWAGVEECTCAHAVSKRSNARMKHDAQCVLHLCRSVTWHAVEDGMLSAHRTRHAWVVAGKTRFHRQTGHTKTPLDTRVNAGVELF